ncbi:Gfo/Idh/MocA family oxidoreductase [bacterium]|nr:Gfo/Idh/MocA family oxidoreductase [bacterium]
MKVAVIGAGAWGKNHVKNLHDMGSLGAIVETSAEARAAFASEYPGIPVWDNINHVLESDIAAAIVVTPAPTHYDIGMELLQNGKDVFIEKPMTLRAIHAEDLVETADKLDRVLMVGHLLLHQPAIQWLKEALDDGLIGKVHSIHQHRLGLGRARSAENVLWSLGVHDVAVVLYLLGKSPSKLNITGHRVLQTDVEDDIYLHLGFPEGIETHLHCSWLWPKKDRGMVIVGTNAMLEYNEADQVVMLHKKTIDTNLQNVDNGSEVIYQGSGQPLRLELEHFIKCCEERLTPISDGRNGLEVIRILQKTIERLRS